MRKSGFGVGLHIQEKFIRKLEWFSLGTTMCNEWKPFQAYSYKVFQKSSGESQNGVITIQRCSIENYQDAIAVQSL